MRAEHLFDPLAKGIGHASADAIRLAKGRQEVGRELRLWQELFERSHREVKLNAKGELTPYCKVHYKVMYYPNKPTKIKAPHGR